MIWILYILGALALLFAITMLVGHNMAPEYAGRAEVLVETSPERVFAALSDFERHPHSTSICKGVERLEDSGGLPSWTEDLGSSVVTVRTLESVAPNRIVREMADSKVPMKARWEFELSPEGNGTRLVLVHRGRIDDGSWFSPIFRVIVKGFGMGNRGAQQFVDSIAVGSKQ